MEGTTQGNLAAMVIYATAIRPLILMLVQITMQDNIHTKTAAYADDLTVAGPLDQIRIFFFIQVLHISKSKLQSLGTIFLVCLGINQQKSNRYQIDMGILNRINCC